SHAGLRWCPKAYAAQPPLLPILNRPAPPVLARPTPAPLTSPSSKGPLTLESSRTVAPPAAFHELPRQRLIMTVAGLMVTLLLAALDQTIVGTAMPRIIAELHGFEHYAWPTTAYLLASTAVVPISGKLSDMYGRKIFLLGSSAGFILASALCGL